MSDAPLLSVRDLTVQFRTDERWITAVDDVGFDVKPRECLGIVGESGSGKSVTALAVLRLHPPGTTRLSSGTVVFGGRDLLGLSRREMRRITGADIAMIFQDPLSSLNPVLTIGDQITETLRLHQGLHGPAARRRAIELLDLVRIPQAFRRVDDYPHRLSGGMRQRVMIAMAIACQPRLLIADEPTTALDVTVQAQILELLRDLQTELGMSLVLISHDLATIAQYAQRVMVMYAGQVVETGPVETLFTRPVHPYTEGLLAARPRIDIDLPRLPFIPGRVPDAGEIVHGCRFHPRCAETLASCRHEPPLLLDAEPGHVARCPPRARPAQAVPATSR